MVTKKIIWRTYAQNFCNCKVEVCNMHNNVSLKMIQIELFGIDANESLVPLEWKYYFFLVKSINIGEDTIGNNIPIEVSKK